MSTIEVFKNTLKIFRFNMILVQPLLIFLVVVALVPISGDSAVAASPALLVLILSLIGLTIAFASGWFTMFQKGVHISKNDGFSSDEERAAFSINLFKEFFPGVGAYFAPMAIGSVIYFIGFFLVAVITLVIAQHFTGQITSINWHEMLASLHSQHQYTELIKKLSPADNTRIHQWNLALMIATNIYSYLTMFWPVAIIEGKKGPISAFKKSLKYTLKKPFTTIAMYLFYTLGSLGFSVVMLLIAKMTATYRIGIIGDALQFIGLLGYILFIVYFILMMFVYFEQVKQNNSSSGANG